MKYFQVIEDNCKVHGTKSSYAYSEIARAWICLQCVAAGFYIPKIVKEFHD